MMGWIITLSVLFLLAILPLGVSVKYNASGPLVRIIAGPAKIKVFPAKKKEKKDTKKKKEKAKEKPAKDKSSKEKKENGTKKKEKGGSVADFLPLVKLVIDFLGDFRRKLRVTCLEAKIILGGGDPCDLATNYGKAWAALGNLWPKLDKWFAIKKRDVEIECDFEASETLIIARLDISITLGRLLGLVFGYAFRALFAYLKIMNKRKGGAQ